jgi:hypothetical protein
MKLPFCVACLAKDDLQHHHLVTRAEGGGSEETNLITLCAAGHHKLHQRYMDGTYNHGKRVRSGQAQAKARGVHFGPKFKLTQHQRKEAKARHDAGETFVDIGRSMNVSYMTIARAVTRMEDVR